MSSTPKSNGRRKDTKDAEPRWRPHLSFRGQPYRLLHHQNGVAGYVKARVLDAKELPRAGIGVNSYFTTEDNLPSIILSIGRVWKKNTPSIHRGSRLSWDRDPMDLEILKEVHTAGNKITLEIQASARKDVSALGAVDLEDLILGQTDTMDIWVELQPRGRIHLLIDYEPRGVNPQRNDIVYLESFARSSSSVIFPRNEPLVVTDARGNYIMASFESVSGYNATICLHRNTVFTIERLSWLDTAINLTAKPVDALLETEAGQWAARKCRPAVTSLIVLAAPVSASCRVAMTSASLAVTAMFHGTMAMTKEYFS